MVKSCCGMYADDVLAYNIIVWGSPVVAALVVGMVVGLVFIKSSYACGFPHLSKGSVLLIFPCQAVRISKLKFSSADGRLRY